MKKRNLALAAVATAIIMIAGIAAFQPTASDASAVNKKKGPGDSTLEFTIELRKGTSAAGMVDAVKKAAGVGSSGIDGFSVDSFFDITYKVSTGAKGFDTEIVAMQLRAAPTDPNMNAGAVIDAVKKTVGNQGDVTVGHVTVLK